MKRLMLRMGWIWLLLLGTAMAQTPDTIQVAIRTVNLALDGDGKIIALSEGRDLNFDGQLQTASGEQPGALFRIDPNTRAVLKKQSFPGFIANLAVWDTVGYLVQRNPLRLSRFDTRTLQVVTDTLVLADSSKGILFYDVSVDPQTGWIYVGTGGFDKPGQVLVFRPDGKLMHRMTTGFGASDVLFHKPVDGLGGREAYIINEGAFGKNNAGLSYLRIQPKLFRYVNGRPLGNTANSMRAFWTGKLFIVLNGSHRIEVMDMNSMQAEGTIDVGTSGYNGPRQVAFLPDDSTGVVSTFANDIRFFSLNSYQITDTLKVGQKPEALEANEQFLFVANGGFTGMSEDSTVFVVDWKNRTIVDTLVTGIRTTQLLKPFAGLLIAVSEGRDKNFDGVLQTASGEVPGRLTMIDENTGNIIYQQTLSGFASVGTAVWYNLGQGPVTHLYLVQKDPLRISRFVVGDDSLWLEQDSLMVVTPENGGNVYHLSVWEYADPPMLLISTGFGSNELLFMNVMNGKIVHRLTMDVGVKHAFYQGQPIDGVARFLVLNEGAFGGDNASLSMVDIGQEIFEPVAGRKLGDTANGGTISGDRLYVAVNGSHTVEVYDVVGNFYVGQVKVGTSGYNGPRQVAIIREGVGLVSTFNNDVRAFDTNSLTVTKTTPVGQKPEDILVVGNRVFVANGGFTGFSEDSTIFVFEDRVLPVETRPGVPMNFAISQAYPNPFVPVTGGDGVRLQLELPQAAEVNVTVYNVLGQRVAEIVRQVLPAGKHLLRWNGRNAQGRIVAPGVYFIRINTPNQVRTRPVVVRQALR